MKLIRYGEPGYEKPGLELDGGKRVDVSDYVVDYTPEFFASGGLERLKQIDTSSCPGVSGDARLGSPVARPHKFVAIGLNYKLHAEEAKMPVPDEPVVFTKHTSCICGPDDGIVIPRGSTKLDYEVELAVVMKDKVRYLDSESEAMAHVAGFTICNDVSERHFQIERGGNWVKGKSCDSFGPLGPTLVTADALPEYQNLELSLKVNGETRQKSNTNDMIFSVPHIIWYLSQFMTLEPGDVIITGTPFGVAMGMNPPQWLQAGDKVEVAIQHLGTQHQVVREN